MSDNSIKLTWTRALGDLEWIAEIPAKDDLGHTGVYRIHAMQRPYYCDRGRFYVLVETVGVLNTIDDADGFPRYYFKLENLQQEMELWVNARRECREAKGSK